jgi:hypothetical protein
MWEGEAPAEPAPGKLAPRLFRQMVPSAASGVIEPKSAFHRL